MKQRDAPSPPTIVRNPSRVIVRLARRVIADTTAALTLREDDHRTTHYIPREDVDMVQLERSRYVTCCPRKGDATYYNVTGYDVTRGGIRSINAAWSYESPNPAVARIKNHIGFDPDRVDCIDEWEHRGRCV
jgi:uncharacterized protein (DUF427 family)